MENKQQYLIPLSIVIAGALVAAGIYFSGTDFGSKNKAAANPGDNQPVGEIDIKPVSSEDHILGNPDAKVVMVEYSDLECPFCKQFHNTLHSIMDEYGKNGDVAWVYRHFPIDQLHSKARKESEATECAFDQGGNDAFWKYTDEVYDRTPSNDGLAASELPKIAGDIGLDVAKFNTCLSSGKFADKVQAHYEDAVAAGGQGTPYTVLITKDGEKLPISEGALPLEMMRDRIEAALAL